MIDVILIKYNYNSHDNVISTKKKQESFKYNRVYSFSVIEPNSKSKSSRVFTSILSESDSLLRMDNSS